MSSFSFRGDYSVFDIRSGEQFVGREHMYEFEAHHIGRVATIRVVRAFGVLVLPGTPEERELPNAVTPKDLGLEVVTRQEVGLGEWDYEKSSDPVLAYRNNLAIEVASLITFMDAFPLDDQRLMNALKKFGANREMGMRFLTAQLKGQIGAADVEGTKAEA